MKIIRIHSVWCPACLVTQKVWNHIKENYKEIEFTEYDYDMDEEEVQKYNPGRKLPVHIFIKDGKEERLIGEKKEEDFIQIIRKWN